MKIGQQVDDIYRLRDSLRGGRLSDEEAGKLLKAVWALEAQIHYQKRELTDKERITALEARVQQLAEERGLRR